MVVKKKKSMNNQMEDILFDDSVDIQQTMPNNKQMKKIGIMVNRVADLEEKIIQVQDDLSKLNNEYNELAMIKIPDLFDEFGLSKLSLTDGTTIEIKRSYSASITDENRAECFKWFKKNKFESLIKHEIVAKLKKGENTEAKQILIFIKKLGITFTDKRTVHPQTLNAFVREQIESGSNFPQEIFKVFPIRKAKVRLATM